MKKIIILAPVILLIFIVGIPALVAGSLGFVPGLSSLMGTNKPRDLGVAYTEADFRSARGKTKLVYDTLPPTTPASQSIQRFGSRPAVFSLSSREASSLMNNRPWKYWPYDNVQIKFNENGSAEVSGIILKDRISGYASAIGAPPEAMLIAEKILNSLPANPVFYLNMKVSVENNTVKTFEPIYFEIGRFPVPIDTLLAFTPPQFVQTALAYPLDSVKQDFPNIKNKKQLIIDYINQRIAATKGFSIRQAYFAKDKLVFDGALAEREATVR